MVFTNIIQIKKSNISHIIIVSHHTFFKTFKRTKNKKNQLNVKIFVSRKEFNSHTCNCEVVLLYHVEMLIRMFLFMNKTIKMVVT